MKVVKPNKLFGDLVFLFTKLKAKGFYSTKHLKFQDAESTALMPDRR